jgi:IS5 family transposase
MVFCCNVMLAVLRNGVMMGASCAIGCRSRAFWGLRSRTAFLDATTLWLFREKLAEARLIEKLFERLDQHFAAKGYIARGGQIIDASIVPLVGDPAGLLALSRGIGMLVSLDANRASVRPTTNNAQRGLVAIRPA